MSYEPSSLNVQELNRRNYEREAHHLNRALQSVAQARGDFREALEAHFAHQLDRGFVQDTLGKLERYQLRSQKHPGLVFYADVNPARASRHAGAGRSEPPPGWNRLHAGCLLCRDNIIWQQRYTQFALATSLPSGPFNIWVNPYPLGVTHVTLATTTHTPQSWMVCQDRAATLAGLQRRIADLTAFANQCPGFLVFENGAGAGASIPLHQHYQALRRWPGLARFPIEEAAHRQMSHGRQMPPFVLDEYPVAALFCRGAAQAVTEQASTLAAAWLEHTPDWRSLTCNLLASRESDADEQINLFLIPRNSSITRVPGYSGAVASLELAGEMVFSTEEERQLLVSGQITFETVWRSLESAQDSESRRILASLFPANARN